MKRYSVTGFGAIWTATFLGLRNENVVFSIRYLFGQMENCAGSLSVTPPFNNVVFC
jgi:hypothetical protein